MKVGVVADVHLANHKVLGGPWEAGLNRRGEQACAVLELAVQTAHEQGCDFFIVAGDLFDTTTPSPQLLTRAQVALNLCATPRRMGRYLMLGNHDACSTAEGDHALGPLGPVAYVIEHPRFVRDYEDDLVLCVPYQPGRAAEWLPAKVDEFMRRERRKKERPAALIIHAGIIGAKTAPYLRDSHDAIPVELAEDIARKHGFPFVLAGNWHERQRHSPVVMQIGALCPTGFDNPGLEGYGTLALVDTEAQRLSYVEIPGPRFLKLQGLDDWHQTGPARASKGATFAYVRWTVPPGDLHKAQAMMEEARRGGWCDGEVLPDIGEARADARTAATRARTAGNLTEAVSGYVASMPLDAGIERDRVLVRTLEYLKR